MFRSYFLAQLKNHKFNIFFLAGVVNCEILKVHIIEIQVIIY